MTVVLRRRLSRSSWGKRTWALFMTAIVLLLSGCMPVIEGLYQPQADGGKVLETMCRYNSGPGRWDTIEFQRAGAVIRFKAVNAPQGNLLRMSIALQTGDVAQFTSPAVQLNSLALREPFALVANHYVWYARGKRNEQSFPAKIVGERYGNTQITYYIDFVAPRDLPVDFEVAPINFLVNDVPMELPKIRFHWEKTLLLMPINC